MKVGVLVKCGWSWTMVWTGSVFIVANGRIKVAPHEVKDTALVR